MTIATTAPSALPRFWADLKTTDFARLDLARCIAVLPVAAIEQHGPRLARTGGDFGLRQS